MRCETSRVAQRKANKVVTIILLLPGSNAGPMNYKANTIIYRFSWEIKELLHIISLNLEGLSGFN